MSDIDQPIPVLDEFLNVVSLVPATDSWCSSCAKPSRIEGPVVEVSTSGVSRWGSTIGCYDCKIWVWTDKDGKLWDVELFS